jgi:hypothetical protein
MGFRHQAAPRKKPRRSGARCRLSHGPLKEESRKISSEARLAVVHSRQRRILQASNLSPTAGYHLHADSDNVGGEGDAFVGGDTPFA